MERASKVTLVEAAPPAPKTKKAKSRENSVLADQKKALELAPHTLVVDNSYPRETKKQSESSVKAAAYLINVGGRAAWPNDTYYAIWRENPENPDVYQLLIGLRSHIHPDWEAIVNRAGSRAKPKTASSVDDSPFEETEDDDAAANAA